MIENNQKTPGQLTSDDSADSVRRQSSDGWARAEPREYKERESGTQ